MRRAKSAEERAFQAWAARLNLRIGLLTALLMPIGGFILIEVLKSDQVGFFDNLVNGQAAWLFIVQEALFGGLLIAGNIALALEAPRGRSVDVRGRVAIAVVTAGMVLGVLPSQALPGGLRVVRYAGIAIAVIVTAVHLFSRGLRPSDSHAERETGQSPQIPAAASALGRRALVAAGALGLAVALFMGYMKEEARGRYVFYGELTQDQGHEPFNPSPSLYP
jgi:hypothetical protein